MNRISSSLLSAGKTFSSLFKSKAKTTYADVVVRNSIGQILLLQKKYEDGEMSEKWGFPGGHIEKGESATIAAVRELREETGLELEVVPLYVKEKEECTIFYFEAYVSGISNVILDNDEHRGYEWVPIEQVSDYNMIADIATYVDREVLSDVYRSIREDRIRLLDNPFTELDNSFKLLQTAFDNDLIDDITFFKARAWYKQARLKVARDIVEKAFDNNQLSDEEYWEIMKGGDPSHGGKLVKKIITDTKGRMQTKWVDPKTGEAPVKEKKPKAEPQAQWFDEFKKYQLNCYPIGIDKSQVDVNTSGDVHSHWILRWRDPKSGALKNAYSKEFMDRNAAEKWNRMKNVSSAQISKIADGAKKMMLKGEDDKTKEAGAIIYIISQTGLRRGDKLKFDKSGNRGVSSLAPDNVTIEGSKVKFSFIGKSYQDNKAEIDDPQLATYLSKLQKEREGSNWLFETSDAIIDSTFDKVGGEGLKIKDMRTYVAGDIARKVLFEDPAPPPPIPDGLPETKVKKLVQDKLKNCYEQVAGKLNNTPTMAKNSYIHPNIIDFWLKKLNLSFEIKKSEDAEQLTNISLDTILAQYTYEENVGKINEEDEEDCDTFNEPESLDEDTLEK